ncbi:MAG: twin-arginine translocase TatA/TatE family subunit [Lachnospiraceae bacterium]|nr:twin-arginine translocase TatA/TatE family subunit [Lachnospiraceae bacterium]
MALLPGRIGSWEFLVIILIILVLFGPKYLPRIGKSLGKTFKSFKEGLDAGSAEENKIEETSEKKTEEEI